MLKRLLFAIAVGMACFLLVEVIVSRVDDSKESVGWIVYGGISAAAIGFILGFWLYASRTPNG